MVHQAKSLVFLLVFVTNRALSSPVGNPCDNVVCENGGTCQSEGSSYICKCADGYSGDSCETQEPKDKRRVLENDYEIIACRGKRCGGGGGGGSYDPCLGVSCYNGGYCTSGKCICPGGTSGTNCLTVDKCYGVTCYYGVCSGGTCICTTGYTGSTCLSKIINGGWSEYSASSGCSANCGGGSMSYSRSCNNPAPANGGATCSGSSTKSESCNTHSCPVNGGWSGWSVSSSCTAACGGGSISYKRSCTNPSPAHGGAYCSGSDSKSESCNTQSCPVNGGWSGWYVSSGCTAACGGGSISYKRSCNNPSPAHGGATCSGSDSKSESCNTHSCPVNGGWSGWSLSSGCTAACGGGLISYKRSCNNPSPAHGGATCSGSDSKSESCNTHSCPVNGGWSGWRATSDCTATCAGGSISYKRTCTNPPPAHGGAYCSGSDSKSESCNTHSCPVNGGWSGWSVSSSCTAACGGGSISYKRSCTNPSPAHGGVYCSGSDTKSESCNTHSCPVNGGWSDWTATSSCTATCGGGSISYSRTCNNPTPAHGGSDCSGSTTTLEKCNTHACPINGGWSGWTTSSSCTAVCGGGTISYKRSCTNPSPAHGGATCSGSDTKSESCNTHSCPVNGGWSGWSTSSSCTAACGGGSISYKRTCTNPSPAHGGATCSGSDTKSESCNTHSCPVNGGWSDWTATSSCTATCGGGSISYSRTCNNPIPAHGGSDCSGSTTTLEKCNTHACPINGGWSGWTMSSSCTAVCGGGTISYKRSCTNPSPAHGGATCSGSDTKSESCNTHSCPVNGGWSGWSTSSSCTAACGGGSISYKRTCTNPSPAHGGATCSGSDTKSESCNNHSCPVNGGWSDWTATSSCTATCGGGSISYSRTCNNPTPAHGGSDCSGSRTTLGKCNTHACPINGGWSGWSVSSDCTATCGGGSISYKRTCTNPAPAYEGDYCSGEDTKSESCNTHNCPVNGGWSGWSTSSSCSATCGGGSISYKRTCTNPAPAYLGAYCSGEDIKSESCNTHNCPVNGEWSDWTASGCTAACGGGSMSYSRTCNNPAPAHGGDDCSGSRTKSESCNTQSCPVNGGWSDWTSWAACSLDCGGGKQRKTRTCTKPAPTHDGLDCGGDSSVSQSCNTHLCPINGGWSGWSATSGCTVACGGGSISYKRSCTNPAPAHGGATCSGSDSKSESCNTHNCPVNGEWSDWTASGCTAACGGGSMSYSRTCNNPAPAHGGDDCSGSSTKSESCNTQSCPVNGGWSDWTSWAACSLDCGGGIQRKTRTCTKPAPTHDGLDCGGDSSASQSCNTHFCPINGRWSDWSPWDTCSVTCGVGKQTKTRSCSNPAPDHGGEDCGNDDSATQTCTKQECPIDECDGIMCLNGGTCITGICLCPSSYTGEVCESEVINGEWSDWLMSISCSNECGGGIVTYYRTCTNPAPTNGGAHCTGIKTKEEPCNMHDCSAQTTTIKILMTTTTNRMQPSSTRDHYEDPTGMHASTTNGLLRTLTSRDSYVRSTVPSLGMSEHSTTRDSHFETKGPTRGMSEQSTTRDPHFNQTGPTRGMSEQSTTRDPHLNQTGQPRGMSEQSTTRDSHFNQTGPPRDMSEQSTTRDPHFNQTGPTHGMSKQSTTRDPHFNQTGPTRDMSEQSTTRDPHFDQTGPTRGMSEQSTTRDPHFNQTGPPRGMSEQSTTRDPHFNQTGPPRDMSEQSTTRDSHFNQTGPTHGMSKQSTSRDPHFNQTGPTRGISEQSTTRDPYKDLTGQSLGMSNHSTTKNAHFNQTGPTRGISEQSTTRDPHFNQTGPSREISEQSTTRTPGPTRGMSETSTTINPHSEPTGLTLEMSATSTTSNPHSDHTESTRRMSATSTARDPRSNPTGSTGGMSATSTTRDLHSEHTESTRGMSETSTTRKPHFNQTGPTRGMSATSTARGPHSDPTGPTRGISASSTARGPHSDPTEPTRGMSVSSTARDPHSDPTGPTRGMSASSTTRGLHSDSSGPTRGLSASSTARGPHSDPTEPTRGMSETSTTRNPRSDPTGPTQGMSASSTARGPHSDPTEPNRGTSVSSTARDPHSDPTGPTRGISASSTARDRHSDPTGSTRGMSASSTRDQHSNTTSSTEGTGSTTNNGISTTTTIATAEVQLEPDFNSDCMILLGNWKLVAILSTLFAVLII